MLKEGLKKTYGSVADVTEATWIRSRSMYSKSYLVTFQQSEQPKSLQIPGEQTATKVYVYRMRPLFCVQCLEYSHSKGKCERQQRCRVGAEHDTAANYEERPKCLHCREEHKTGNRICKRQQKEMEIYALQNDQKVPCVMAKQIYMSRRPNPIRSYAEVTGAAVDAVIREGQNAETEDTQQATGR